MRWLSVGFAAGVLVWGVGLGTVAASAQTPAQKIDEALQNISNVVRDEKVGYATVFDGNKYVQCRRLPSREVRCEAAGAALQPSLERVLTPERQSKLKTLGWVLDPSFGNFVRTFPADRPTSAIAEKIVEALTQGYAAEPERIELRTAWVADLPCPPRNGRSQNLAGSVTDSAAMRPSAIKSCTYTANLQRPETANSADDLQALYGTMVTAEIQRLRINAVRHVFAVFDAGIGYIQCAPDVVAREIYCEAQSAESWEALSAVLTPERIAVLHKLGYEDPGRVPNYAKSYPFAKFNDAAIASELLTILYDVYGYRGATKLKIIAN
jgi:hypothetical protein